MGFSKVSYSVYINIPHLDMHCFLLYYYALFKLYYTLLFVTECRASSYKLLSTSSNTLGAPVWLINRGTWGLSALKKWVLFIMTLPFSRLFLRMLCLSTYLLMLIKEQRNSTERQKKTNPTKLQLDSIQTG